MRALVLCLCLPLCGCAGSRFHGKNGQKLFETQANISADEIALKADGGFWAKNFVMNHSVPTRAAGAVIGNAATGISGLITAQAAAGLLGGR